MRFLHGGREGTRRGLPLAGALVTLLGIAPAADAAISVSDATPVGEGTANAALSFEVSKTFVLGGSAATVRFRTTTGTATAGSDYTSRTQTVSLPNTLLSGSSTTVTVPILADTLDELDETVVVSIDEPTGDTISDASATGTITDDDAPPTVSIAAASGAEGTARAGTIALPVTLSAASGQDITVPYTITAGTASIPADIGGAPGSLTITAGKTTGAITVATVADAVDEADETFTVTLGTPTAGGAGLGTPSTATGTVTNDDAPVISIGGVAAVEGTAATPTAYTFPVTLSGAGRGPVTVRVRTADVQAVAPGDYTAVDEVVTFPAGETAKSVTVQVVADAIREEDEAFSVTLSEPAGGTLGNAVALGAIQNDDAPPPLVPVPGPGTPTSPGTPTTPTGPVDASQPIVRLASLSYRRSGTTYRVKVTCPASETRCTGAVTVFNVVVPKSKNKTLRREVRLARGTFTLAGGASTTLVMKPTSAAKKLLKAAKTLRIRGYGVARDPAGNTGIATKTATIRR